MKPGALEPSCVTTETSSPRSLRATGEQPAFAATREKPEKQRSPSTAKYIFKWDWLGKLKERKRKKDVES